MDDVYLVQISRLADRSPCRSGLLGRVVQSQLTGEGFVLKFSGAGRVLVSSRNQGGFIDWIFSRRPRDKAEKERG